MKKVIIIGGGASGLACAITSARLGNEVLIIDKNKNVGKKILVTGNGRCNYFNEDFTTSHYTSYNGELLEDIITNDNKYDVLEFFDSLGIVPNIKNGYYYPSSSQAVSIQNILYTECKLNNVKFNFEEVVNNVTYNNGFTVYTNKGKYNCDKVVIATGSRALYDTEVECIGYDIAKSFGHKIKPVLPGLTKLNGNETFFKEWNGIRTDASLELYFNDQYVRSERGEIQLTSNGISGICTMTLSNYAVHFINNKDNVYVKINFLDFLDIHTSIEFIDFIKNRNSKLHGRTISELFDGVINYKLSNLLLKLAKINLDNKVINLEDSKLLLLGELFTGFKLNIDSYSGFKDAQICTGGVSLEEVNVHTFESKKQRGLYIIGEVLDVSGDCGGYNLGFAWLSGIKAGADI